MVAEREATLIGNISRSSSPSTLALQHTACSLAISHVHWFWKLTSTAAWFASTQCKPTTSRPSFSSVSDRKKHSCSSKGFGKSQKIGMNFDAKAGGRSEQVTMSTNTQKKGKVILIFSAEPSSEGSTISEKYPPLSVVHTESVNARSSNAPPSGQISTEWSDEREEFARQKSTKPSRNCE